MAFCSNCGSRMEDGAPVLQEKPIVFGASLIRKATDTLAGKTTQLIISDVSILETATQSEFFFDDIVDMTPWTRKASRFTVSEFIAIKVKSIRKYPKFNSDRGDFNKMFFDGAPIVIELDQYNTNMRKLMPILTEKWQKRKEQKERTVRKKKKE